MTWTVDKLLDAIYPLTLSCRKFLKMHWIFSLTTARDFYYSCKAFPPPFGALKSRLILQGNSQGRSALLQPLQGVKWGQAGMKGLSSKMYVTHLSKPAICAYDVAVYAEKLRYSVLWIYMVAVDFFSSRL